MYKMMNVSNKKTIASFLNKKFLEWQVETGERKTVGQFAELFGASQPIMSLWMNSGNDRVPGNEYRKRIIRQYGTEAAKAFGEDPDLHFLQENWEDLTPEARRAVREQVEKFKSQNESKRVSKKRRTT